MFRCLRISENRPKARNASCWNYSKNEINSCRSPDKIPLIRLSDKRYVFVVIRVCVIRWLYVCDMKETVRQIAKCIIKTKKYFDVQPTNAKCRKWRGFFWPIYANFCIPIFYECPSNIECVPTYRPKKMSVLFCSPIEYCWFTIYEVEYHMQFFNIFKIIIMLNYLLYLI